jgi:hypothetical protein
MAQQGSADLDARSWTAGHSKTFIGFQNLKPPEMTVVAFFPG